jgi:hypothetical protein
MMRTSEDSDGEIESVESTDGADPGKVKAKHITPLLFLPLSVCWTLRCLYAETLLSCCVLQYANAGAINHSLSQIHHLCTCNSDPRVLVQGAEADEILPPSAETFSQSAKTDKTVQARAALSQGTEDEKGFVTTSSA